MVFTDAIERRKLQKIPKRRRAWYRVAMRYKVGADDKKSRRDERFWIRKHRRSAIEAQRSQLSLDTKPPCCTIFWDIRPSPSRQRRNGMVPLGPGRQQINRKSIQ